MTKQEWIAEYAKEIIRRAALDSIIALELAEASYEDWRDYLPISAVDEELSYWYNDE